MSLALFAKAVQGGQGRLALGETIAHLHRLERLGLVERRLEPDGIVRFARSGDATASLRAGEVLSDP